MVGRDAVPSAVARVLTGEWAERMQYMYGMHLDHPDASAEERTALLQAYPNESSKFTDLCHTGRSCWGRSERTVER